MNSLQSKNEAFKKYEFKRLCHIIGFKQLEITSLLETVNKNYTVWSEKKIDKKSGKVKTYSDGTEKTRTFRNPSQLLKTVQSRIKKNILDNIGLPDNLHGGIKGRSNATNALAHKGNKYFFLTDLQEFYPNIGMKQVYEMFVKQKFSAHFSHWLTAFTTRSNELPQGAPTSTGVSNLVFLETDYRLIDFCKRNNITYTRFIDDLTFSSQQNFSHLTNELIEMVKANGFKISQRKTQFGAGESITGIDVFLNKIDAPEKIIEKSKSELQTNAITKPYTNYRNYILRTNNAKKA